MNVYNVYEKSLFIFFILHVIVKCYADWVLQEVFHGPEWISDSPENLQLNKKWVPGYTITSPIFLSKTSLLTQVSTWNCNGIYPEVK